MRYDLLIQELENDARGRLGDAQATAILTSDWVDRLPEILAWAPEAMAWRPGGPKVTPTLDVRDGAADANDWHGEVEVWPDTSDMVIVRRLAIHAGDGMTSLTLAAARSRAVLDCR